MEESNSDPSENDREQHLEASHTNSVRTETTGVSGGDLRDSTAIGGSLNQTNIRSQHNYFTPYDTTDYTTMQTGRLNRATTSSQDVNNVAPQEKGVHPDSTDGLVAKLGDLLKDDLLKRSTTLPNQHPDGYIMKVDLRKIHHCRRMETEHNIRMSVTIAEVNKSETEHIYRFLGKLYSDTMDKCLGEEAHHPGSMIQPFIRQTEYDEFEVDLTGISCKILQYLAKMNIQKIVYLVGFSQDNCRPISEFIDRKYISLLNMKMHQSRRTESEEEGVERNLM